MTLENWVTACWYLQLSQPWVVMVGMFWMCSISHWPHWLLSPEEQLGLKRALGSLELELQVVLALCGYWGLNLGLLEKQPASNH